MTANALCANGVKVYITGRRVELLKQAETTRSDSGGSIIAVPLDVTNKDSIKDFVKTISEKEKYINLLVNNAGITSVNYGEKWTPSGNPKEVSERMLNYQGFEDWDKVYRVNVASVYFMSVACLPLLCAARDHGFSEAGSILIVSSISGITKTSQNGQFRYVLPSTSAYGEMRSLTCYSYNAAKAATISLTEQLAVELKNPGLEVRVNTLAPGTY